MKHLLTAAFFCAALCASLLLLNQAMQRRDGRDKYAAFFSEDQEIDVFFLGTSHVMDSVYPNILWRDYGFTSYNLGNAAEPMDATCWTLRLAAQVHKPRVAVIDVCYMDRVQQGSAQAFNHIFLDELPLSRLKLEAVWSLFPEGSRAEFVFPLVLYHNRWGELLFGGAQEMTACPDYMYGAELRVGRVEPAPFERTALTDSENTPGRDALRSLLEFCLSSDIQPVLVAIPYPAEQAAQISMNSAALVAQEYGVPFLNLFDVEGLVDFDTDCYDSGSHLNPDGAIKVTAYLGRWLSEHFSLPDRRGDARYTPPGCGACAIRAGA